MKIMMIDIGNYASQRLRWRSVKDQYDDVEVIPDVWDAAPWAIDVVRYYQGQGYDVILFSTVATNRLQQVDIMQDLCRCADIKQYFAEDDRGCVIYGEFDNRWSYQVKETDRLALEEAILYVQQSNTVDDLFVTTDSKIFYDICAKLDVQHQWIGETHSVALSV